MKKQHTEQKSIRLAIFFCLLVLVASLIALTYKAVNIIKTSTFDGSQRYTLYIERTPTLGEVLSFDPQTKSLSRVMIKSKTLLSSPSTLFGIPVDVRVTLDGNTDPTTSDIPPEIFALFFKKHSTDIPLTGYDLFRLYSFSRSVSQDSLKNTDLSIPVSEGDVDNQLSGFFTDATIVKENKTVAIVNGSGISGMGKRAERVLTMMGVTVISVTTAREDIAVSNVQYREKSSYTAEKIGKIFHFSSQKMTDEHASDITIIIGKDVSDTIAF